VGPSKHEGEDLNYFVTGATGFIGRNLVEELLKRDGTVYALVREGSKGRLDDLGQRLGAGDRLVPVPGDLAKEGLGIEGFDQRIDHFFHLAAIYDIESDDESLSRANVDGTRHTVEFANSIEVGRFHHTSSIAVAGKYKGLFREDMFDEGQKLPHAYHATKF
jgi:thioester reductase-like protein